MPSGCVDRRGDRAVLGVATGRTVREIALHDTCTIDLGMAHGGSVVPRLAGTVATVRSQP